MTEQALLTAAQMRWADQYTINTLGVFSGLLMQHAGEAVAREARKRFSDGQRLVVVAGRGNNGGDGFAAAAYLRREGVPVKCVLLGMLEGLSGDAAAQAKLCRDRGVSIAECSRPGDLSALDEELRRADLIVDALFGTGLARPVEDPAAAVVGMINASEARVLSVDIASGIESDSGCVLGAAVKATWTLPVAACKWGHWFGEGRELAGEVLAPAPIGIPHEVIEQSMRQVEGPAASARLIGQQDIDGAFPRRPRTAHKRDFGHVWIFGGSKGYTGAPRLAAMGAFAAGAGLVSIACPEDVYGVIAPSCLEVMVHTQDAAPWGEAGAVLAGPGWGTEQVDELAALMAGQAPLVLDADGLNMLAAHERLAAALIGRTVVSVLTPHAGEAARLLGKAAGHVQENRLASALALARMFQAWAVLKGADSLIASPKGDVWLCPFGSSRLATAGTGDVLAGMIAAMLGRGLAVEVALPAAVGLHALAGESGGWHLAGELAGAVGRIARRRESEALSAAE